LNFEHTVISNESENAIRSFSEAKSVFTRAQYPKMCIRLISIFNEFPNEVLLVRISKCCSDPRNAAKERDDLVFKKNEATQYDNSRFESEPLIQLQSSADLPTVNRAHSTQGKLKTTLSLFYTCCLVVILSLNVVIIQKIENSFEEYRCFIAETKTVSDFPNLIISSLKQYYIFSKYNDEDLAGDVHIKNFFHNKSITTLQKEIEISYLSLLSISNKRLASSYSELDANSKSLLQRNSSLLFSEEPKIDSDDGVFTQYDYNSILFQFMHHVSLNQENELSRLRVWASKLVSIIHEFYENNRAVNLDKMVLLKNSIEDFSFIISALVSFSVLCCILVAEIIEGRIQVPFYDFAYLSKKEIARFVAMMESFEELFGKKPMFDRNERHSKRVIEKRNEGLRPQFNSKTLNFESCNSINEFSEETKGKESFPITTDHTKDEFNSKSTEAKNRSNRFRKKNLQLKSMMILRNIGFLTSLALCCFINLSYLMETQNSNKILVEHFNQVFQIANHMHMMKFTTINAVLTEDLDASKEDLEGFYSDVVNNFKNFKSLLNKFDKLGMLSYPETMAAMSKDLCDQIYFADSDIQEILTSDCKEIQIMSRGFEAFSIHLCNIYSQLFQGSLKVSDPDVEKDILIMEYWASKFDYLLISEFIRNFNLHLKNDLFILWLSQVLFFLVTTFLGLLLLRLRFRSRDRIIRLNGFAASFMNSSIVAGNVYISSRKYKE
jgi:hypothetical protein